MENKSAYQKQMEQIANLDKMIEGLDQSINVFGETTQETIDNLTDENQKQQVAEMKAMANLAFQRAKNGGDYNSVINKMKNKFNHGGKNS